MSRYSITRHRPYVARPVVNMNIALWHAAAVFSDAKSHRVCSQFITLASASLCSVMRKASGASIPRTTGNHSPQNETLIGPPAWSGRVASICCWIRPDWTDWTDAIFIASRQDHEQKKHITVSKESVSGSNAFVSRLPKNQCFDVSSQMCSFTARRHASACSLLAVDLQYFCICLSVTSRSSVETAERMDWFWACSFFRLSS